MADIVSLRSNAERYYQRGNNASYAGNLPEAVYYLKQAVAADRTNKKYFVDLLSVFNQIGFYEETVSYGAEALALNGLETADKCAVYFYMGEACYCLGLNDASVRYINLCINQDSKSLFYNDAMLYKNELDKFSNNVDEDITTSLDNNQSSAIANQFALLELFAKIKNGSADIDSAYLQAEEALKQDPSNINAILCGYEAAIGLNNTFAKKRYRSMLVSIRDCSDLEMKTLCFYFSQSSDHSLAKDVFASIYNGNTFWKEACFALAVAFYNTGEANAALKIFDRLNLLEGGNGIANLCISNIKLNRPPQKLSYLYAPNGEQMDLLCSELFSLLENANKEGKYERIGSLLHIAIKYADPAGLGEMLSLLDVTDENIKTIISEVLYDYTIDPSKKLLLSLLLWETYPECNAGVNIMGDIVNIQDIAEKFKMRNFNVPYDLENEFGPNAVGDVYYAIPSLGIIDMDAPEEEFAFVANILLLLEKGEKIDYRSISNKYNISVERIDEIIIKMKEKRLISNEID